MRVKEIIRREAFLLIHQWESGKIPAPSFQGMITEVMNFGSSRVIISVHFMLSFLMAGWFSPVDSSYINISGSPFPNADNLRKSLVILLKQTLLITCLISSTICIFGLTGGF